MATHFQRKGRRILGFDLQQVIKGFFGTNAGLSIVILILICGFLLREAVLFFPGHHDSLKLFRKTGQEYVDHIITEVDAHSQLVSLTNQAFAQEQDALFRTERGLIDCFEALLEPIEDDCDDVVEALEEALDGEDEAAIAKARADWQAYVQMKIDSVKREDIDSFGRLEDNDEAWNDLLAAMLTYDPIEEEPPALIEEAEERMSDGMAAFNQARNQVRNAGKDLKRLRNDLVKKAADTAKDAKNNKAEAVRKGAILKGAEKLEGEEKAKAIAKAEAITVIDDFPYGERVEPILATKPQHEKLANELIEKLSVGVAALPTEFESSEAGRLIGLVRKAEPEFQKNLKNSVAKANEFQWDEPLGLFDSATKFFFGTEWVTNSSWQDVYGFLPLFQGSFIISLVALVVAVPFSIGAAIYVNRLATRREQTFIKPSIEMIQAIPSVVLGFFGILVLGEALKNLSQEEWLHWVPGFPMQERLNYLNAGLLLAIMAVPTIFTLCEDALNNVPRAYSEASLALGASKLQTIVKVIVPTAISGILAAVLLGFGRVIGETMVVLLVAGNQISMPDWGQGLGILVQPTHTMTGIIAQEMGEVTKDTLHFRALFLVGLVLFTISLVINVLAQRIIKRLGKHG